MPIDEEYRRFRKIFWRVIIMRQVKDDMRNISHNSTTTFAFNYQLDGLPELLSQPTAPTKQVSAQNAIITQSRFRASMAKWYWNVVLKEKKVMLILKYLMMAENAWYVLRLPLWAFARNFYGAWRQYEPLIAVTAVIRPEAMPRPPPRGDADLVEGNCDDAAVRVRYIRHALLLFCWADDIDGSRQ